MKKNRIILGAAAIVASFVSLVAFKAQNKFSGGTIYTKSSGTCVLHTTCATGGTGDGCALGTTYYSNSSNCTNNVAYTGHVRVVS